MAAPGKASNGPRQRWVIDRVQSGIVLESPPGRLVCLRPLRAVSCSGSRRSKLIPCGSRCEPCRLRNARRVREVAESGLTFSGHSFVYLVTLTAPGAGVDLASWNPTAAYLFSQWIQALRREVGMPIEYFRAVELQRRGAIHLHLLVSSPVPISKRRFGRLALEYGFGRIFDVRPVSDVHAARYVTKYVSKASSMRSECPWTPGKRPSYRTWSRSVRFGHTMARVRQEALGRWMAWDLPLPDPVVVEAALTSEANPP